MVSLSVAGQVGGRLLQSLDERLALDVEVREQPAEPARQAPGAAPEQRHHGRHERHADHERVGQDAEGERQADRLDDRVGVEDERPEDARS